MKIEINDDDSVTIDGRVYVPRDGAPDEPKPWPQEGDIVFLLCHDGEIIKYRFNPGRLAHTKALSQGSVFPIREAAEAERDRRAAETRVLRRLDELRGDWRPDWKSPEQRKYCPAISHQNDVVRIYYIALMQEAPANWYGPREAWEQVIEEMPNDVRRMMG